ncbi:PEP-CTERM sorting domain-containing protein [Methylobacillus flagellatus]|uniref:PEP-CTERM sorting domain-containing protein n=1 Tax=Methylobacillus flagellatus TaxID=405 RepID=UPI002853F328|nr:PEP-CTERM sorting domain-containing protein [Methylobacillus flagellatus]MDR5171551.1 PEP-CTERM sorting domain-containing protein [Methylobacillus flagellatus]
MNTTLSSIALATSLVFSGSALAAGGAWDSAAPWGDAEPVQLTEWNTFGSPVFDNTPDIGAGTISLSPAGATPFGNDIYTLNSIPTITATLAGTAGLFDVYLRVATQGNLLASNATLNGVNATSILAYTGKADLGSGEEQELYWVWNNVAGADLYTFQFKAAKAHILIDQVALATVAVAAVPEPSTYAMLALGLGILGAASRRRKK